MGAAARCRIRPVQRRSGMWRNVAIGVVLSAVLLAGCSVGSSGTADQPSGELRGMVALSSTKGTSPIPFARVQAVKVTGGAGSANSKLSIVGVEADRYGRFALRLPVGRYTLSLILKGGTAQVHQTVRISAGHETRVRLVEFAS